MIVSGVHLGQLAVQTIKDPGGAAQRVIAMALPRDVLWTVMALVCVANAILMWMSNSLTPPVPAELADQVISLPAAFSSPLVMFVFLAGALVIMAHLLHWIGAIMGGAGSLTDMVSVLVWLQLMRGLAQVGLIVLLIFAPFLTPFYALAVAFGSLWIMAHFVNVGAQFGSLMKTIGLLLIASLGILIGLGTLLTVTGVATMGVVPNV